MKDQAETVEEISVEEQEKKLRSVERRDEMFSGLTRELTTELGKAISDKTSVENRMLADEAQYWGLPEGGWDKEDITAGYDRTSRSNSRGSAVDNKTRSKTRIASARIGDMLFPTNMPNWAIYPSPYPDVPMNLIMEEYKKEQAANAPPEQAGGAPPEQALMAAMPPDQMGMGEQGGPMAPRMPQGQQAPPPPPMEELNYDELAQKVSHRRCRKMQQRIRDVLSENRYPKMGRSVIMDGCKLGTGIIKGPYVRYQIKRSYDNQRDDEGEIAVLKVEKVKVPGVARVSPWMFFPQRARCIEEAEHAFELHLLSRTQLQQMVESHGFYPDQTSKLLKTRPSLGQVEGILSKRAAITNHNMSRYENTYAVWEYEGVIDAEVLRQMGFPIEEEDELTSYYGAVWFADNIVLRVDMAPLEATSTLPYRVWNYEEDETSIFGFGVPFVMRDDQYVIDMVWSSILHNVSVSAGPQIAVEKGVLIPADKSYHINGPKLWYKNDVDVPMKQAIDAIIIPSTVNTTMPVYQQALQNADTNTNLPLMLGDGQASSQQQGLSGAAQITIMNQTNIVQRQSAHAWDDNITNGLITGLYQWFMESDEEDIKGDFQVEVRGASHLLVKDTQAQHVQMLLQMALGDPELKAGLDMEELYRIYLSFLEIPVDTLVKSPEQKEADAANVQPDPIQQAEVAKLESETNLNNAKAQSEQTRAQESGSRDMEVIDHAEIMKLELKYAELQDKERDREHDMQKELIRRETKLIEIASKEGLEYEKLNASISSERENLMATLQMDEQTRRSRDYFDAAKLQIDKYREQLKAQNMSMGFDSVG